MIGHQYLLMDVVYQRNLEYKGVQVVAHAHYVGNPRRCECGRPVGRGFHGLQVTSLRDPVRCAQRIGPPRVAFGCRPMLGPLSTQVHTQARRSAYGGLPTAFGGVATQAGSTLGRSGP